MPPSNSSSTPVAAHVGPTCAGRLEARRSTAISDGLMARAASSDFDKAGSWLEAEGSSGPRHNERQRNLENRLGVGPRGKSELRVTLIGFANILGEIVICRSVSEDILKTTFLVRLQERAQAGLRVLRRTSHSRRRAAGAANWSRRRSHLRAVASADSPAIVCAATEGRRTAKLRREATCWISTDDKMTKGPELPGA